MNTKIIIQPLFILACAIGLSGCVSGLAIQAENMTQVGPDPLMNQRLMEEIDIIELLSPSSFPVSEGPASISRKLFGKSKRESIKKNLTIEEAYEELGRSLAGQPQRAILRRNEIQDRIIAASNQRCGAYIQRLKQFDAETNLQLGFLTTAFATAGAIFSAESTIRASSGLAALFSGFRAEFNQEYFSNKTVHIIAEGIRSGRSEILRDIYQVRENASITDYTIWAAIADGIAYHDNCSLVAGLEQVARAVERVDNPGIKQMVKVFNELGAIQNGVNNLPRLASAGVTALSAQNNDAQAAGDSTEIPQIIYIQASKALMQLNLRVDAGVPASPKLKLESLPAPASLSVDSGKYRNATEVTDANNRLANLKTKIATLTSTIPTITNEVIAVVGKYSTTFNTALANNDLAKIVSAQNKLPSLKANVQLADSPEKKLKAELELNRGNAELKFYFDNYTAVLAAIQTASAKGQMLEKDISEVRRLAQEFGFDNS